MVYFFAALAGVMVITSMSMNSRLASRIGSFQATFMNYAAGLSVIVAAAAFGGALTGVGWAFPAPFFLFGGLLGVAIVASVNLILPKVPVVYVTALMFVGQIVAGLAMDLARDGRAARAKVAGAALVFAGVLVNALQDRETAPASVESPAHAPADPPTGGLAAAATAIDRAEARSE